MPQIILPMLIPLHIVPFELAPPAAAALLADAGDEIHLGGSRQERTVERVSGWVEGPGAVEGAREVEGARAVDTRLRRCWRGREGERVWVGR